MVAHALAERPNECCGLLAGRVEDGPPRVGRVVERFPLVNAAGSPVEFVSEPASMFAAVRAMHAAGLDILAVYHSHPTSAAVPSRTDRERNYSPDVATAIVSLHGPEPDVRVWWLTADDAREADWDVV